MKTFKQHLSEHSGAYKRQWMDQDTMPSAANALEALNSLIGQMAEHEYLNPQVGIEKLQSGLGKLGIILKHLLLMEVMVNIQCHYHMEVVLFRQIMMRILMENSKKVMGFQTT